MVNSVEWMVQDVKRQLADLPLIPLPDASHGKVILAGSGDSYVAALAAQPQREVDDGPEVRRFQPVVQLVEQRLTELGDDPLKTMQPAHLGVMIEELGDLIEGVEIGCDLRADFGALDLDDDGATAAQHGAMHLA